MMIAKSDDGKTTAFFSDEAKVKVGDTFTMAVPRWRKHWWRLWEPMVTQETNTFRVVEADGVPLWRA